MRLIDADKLYPDSVSIKGDRLCISQSQIANAPTVWQGEYSTFRRDGRFPNEDAYKAFAKDYLNRNKKELLS